MLILFSASQSGRGVFPDDQLVEPRPSPPPRSSARLPSLPPEYPKTILNFVPSSAFIAFGYCEDVEPPVAPTVTSRRLASSIVLMPEACHAAVVLFSTFGLPM